MDDRAWIRSTVGTWEARLVSYACRLLGGDVDRARDVVQDVFLRLWQADRRSVEGHEGAWLYAVCRNRAIDVRRKDDRMVITDDRGVEAAGARAGRRTVEPSEAASAGEAPIALLDLVSELPPRQQEAVRLRFQGGLSYADIATVMDTSTSNVGVLLHVAVKSLRAGLEAADGDPTTRSALAAEGGAG